MNTQEYFIFKNLLRKINIIVLKKHFYLWNHKILQFAFFPQYYEIKIQMEFQNISDNSYI